MRTNNSVSMQQKLAMLVFTAVFWSTISGLSAGESGPVFKTGQTKSLAPGDDGQLQKGTTWPGLRFNEISDGTVFDGLTSLIWMKNASCWGSVSWNSALTKINELNNGSVSCPGFSGKQKDWRLPNSNELESLIDSSRISPALPANHPFSSVTTSGYWTSSVYAGNTSNAWYVDLDDGKVDAKDIMTGNGVWPVRSGQWYSQQDLSGTWNSFALVSGDASQKQRPGWAYSAWTLNSSGIPFQTTTSVDSIIGTDKNLDNGSDTAITLDQASGKFSIPAKTVYGKMNREKNMIAAVYTGAPASMEKGPIGYTLSLLVKSGGTFTSSDLDGTWTVHGLFVGDAPAQKEGWSYTTYVSSSGQVTAKTTTSSGLDSCASSGPINMTIATDGRISTNNTTASGTMSQTKDFFVVTATEDWTKKSSCATELRGYAMYIGIKNGGTTYSTADMNGVWHLMGVRGGDTPLKNPGTVQDKKSIDAKGNVTNLDGAYSKPLNISSDGVITSGSDISHCVMNKSKSVAVCSGTDTDGDSRGDELYLAIKE